MEGGKKEGRFQYMPNVNRTFHFHKTKRTLISEFLFPITQSEGQRPRSYLGPRVKIKPKPVF